MYRPKEAFTIAAEILTPTYTKVKGVTRKSFPDSGELFYCSFKTYGGTETTVNGVLTVIDTANVETWYRPDITAECGIKIGAKIYEIIGNPENIDMRNQFLKFKVRGVHGGA